MSVAAFVEGAAGLGAAGTAGATLVAAPSRGRALAMLAALLLGAIALSPIVDERVSGQFDRHGPLAAAAIAGGVVAVGLLAWLIRRRPEALVPLAFLALPFRVPLTVGGDTANLLVPLYAVIVAGCLAAIGRPDEREGAAAGSPPPRAVRWVERMLAVVIVLYALQALYSDDLAQAAKNVAFFYVPFAVLYRLLRDVRWTRELLARCLWIVAGLALVFAAVGFVEFATQRLLIPNSKVLHANEIKPYFRVNSLFFDPNIYGRFLALTMIALAARLLWSEARREIALLGIALAVLWAGLVLSLSQSSFAALLVGLAILAALRWRWVPIAALAAAAAVVAVVVVLVTPQTFGLHSVSLHSLDRATSGRAGLVRGGAEMFAAHPVAGVGAGGFEERYRRREHIRSQRVAAVSHTIPVTIAAEQGAIGLVAYVLLLVAALVLLFGGGVVRALAARPPPAQALGRAVAAAAFWALVVHTFVYAAFLEDPLTWVLLALAAALSAGTAARATPARAPGVSPGSARSA